MDFSLLPPEVNSGRMYAGSGSAPLLAAAESWQGLSGQLSSAAVSYQRVLSGLTDEVWRGPSAMAMAASVQPYVEWMSTTAAQAAQAASQARTAAAAYEAAFAETVPPEVVAANRTMLTGLIATNTFGQNASAIAANQAQYGEMWAQDAAAMHGYTANAAAATQLTPFAAAPQDSDPAQANTFGSGIPGYTELLHFLQNLGNNSPIVNYINSPQSIFTSFDNLLMGASNESEAFADTLGEWSGAIGFLLTPEIDELWQYAIVWLAATQGAATQLGLGGFAGILPNVLMSQVSPSAAAATLASSSSVGVSAGLGQAVSVGTLSVPAAWGAAVPDVRLAATALPAGTALSGLPAGALGPGLAGMGGLGGAPMLNSVVNTPRNNQGGSRQGAQGEAASESERLAAEGAGGDGRRGLASGSTADVSTPLSDRERDELEQLRRKNAQLVYDRDAAARLVREAIRR